MPEAENTTLIEMTAEVVAAYVSKNHVRAAELPELTSTVHASLAGMGTAPAAEPEPAKLIPPVSIRKSITDEHLISLENGKRYVSLKRHLAKHGLTPATTTTDGVTRLHGEAIGAGEEHGTRVAAPEEVKLASMAWLWFSAAPASVRPVGLMSGCWEATWEVMRDEGSILPHASRILDAPRAGQ